MNELPPIEAIKSVLRAHWDVPKESVTTWPSSRRLFGVNGLGLARVNFARGGLSAAQLVDLINMLGRTGCPVPELIPSSSGLISVEMDDVALSVEEVVPGGECSDASSVTLRRVGQALGHLHARLAEFAGHPGGRRPMSDWVTETLGKAEAMATQWHHGHCVRALRSRLGNTHQSMSARFGLTHGDVRGPNVLNDGATLRFVDFNCKFEPQVSDLVKMRNKWLMSPQIKDERPLTTDEIAGVLVAYHETYPLAHDDIVSFPVVWSVEQAWRLSQELRTTSQFGEVRSCRWPISKQMEALPESEETGRSILRLAGLL